MLKQDQIGEVVKVEIFGHIHNGKFGFIEMCNNSQLWAHLKIEDNDDGENNEVVLFYHIPVLFKKLYLSFLLLI